MFNMEDYQEIVLEVDGNRNLKTRVYSGKLTDACFKAGSHTRNGGHIVTAPDYVKGLLSQDPKKAQSRIYGEYFNPAGIEILCRYKGDLYLLNIHGCMNEVYDKIRSLREDDGNSNDYVGDIVPIGFNGKMEVPIVYTPEEIDQIFTGMIGNKKITVIEHGNLSEVEKQGLPQEYVIVTP